ncbi:ATP-binding cassette domain-containing protein [Mobilitalea sibirica]|uniref:ATP-binding cassette domain-containing protein n=1 Tax=Mobilitalea sibirica TaxID=1462919 RepID=A0A8J7H1L9_9FIRM|nr:ATP-binding cassette domain-containing protein [Mobilitalea sibirica]MBH1940322.1 ATP-binding cassette domain-containing protein [Mobilitalea sibirica]
MIEVKNLVKRYGNHTAVDNLSFTVDKGQVLGFLGPNGAGKSTTMNIITGYISATGGTVTVNGVDVYEEPEEVKKMIGYLPEFPPLYPDMTVTEYLNFVADIKKVNKAGKKQMIADIMESTRITPVSNRLIKHLSKGYKQRVGLAQAIMGYPELIILDEPTVGLDPKQIIEIRELIKELSKNHTVILSSHIMQEVSAVCDTVMIIDKGKLVLNERPIDLSTNLGNTGGMKLCVKGDRNIILDALERIERITNIVEHEPTTEGIMNLTVNCDENEDIREEVFYAMCDAKAPILEMQSIHLSLEDIFLKVTAGDGIGDLNLDGFQDKKEVSEAIDENHAEDVQNKSEENLVEEEDNSNAGDL